MTAVPPTSIQIGKTTGIPLSRQIGEFTMDQTPPLPRLLAFRHLNGLVSLLSIEHPPRVSLLLIELSHLTSQQIGELMIDQILPLAHCPPLLTPGQGSMNIFNVWFLILQATSLVRIWPKVNLFWSDFGEKCLFRVF